MPVKTALCTAVAGAFGLGSMAGTTIPTKMKAPFGPDWRVTYNVRADPSLDIAAAGRLASARIAEHRQRVASGSGSRRQTASSGMTRAAARSIAVATHHPAPRAHRRLLEAARALPVAPTVHNGHTAHGGKAGAPSSRNKERAAPALAQTVMIAAR